MLYMLGLTLTDQARFGWEKDRAATYEAALDCATRALTEFWLAHDCAWQNSCKAFDLSGNDRRPMDCRSASATLAPARHPSTGLQALRQYLGLYDPADRTHRLTRRRSGRPSDD